jgi:tRNA threonylcarbamoyladenosine biosynthesis protein TsaE
MKIYHAYSSVETEKLGRKLVMSVMAKGPRKSGATVVALTGELGSGKTTFVKGFFKGLGARERVTSPTFIIMRRTALPNQRSKIKNQNLGFEHIYHIDAYRIKRASDILELGFKDILSDPRNIVIIEWAENVRRVLPKKTIWLNFHHGKKGNEREVILV